MKKNFVIPILIIIAVITVPIGINILTIFKMPFGSGSTDSWVGFWRVYRRNIRSYYSLLYFKISG